MTRRIKTLALLGLAILAVAVAAGTPAGAGSTPRVVGPARDLNIALVGKVVVVVSLNASLRGRFSTRGAISDAGRARGRRTASGNRVSLILTLWGRDGRITLLATQVCGRSKSAWRVLSGSRQYAGLSGGGAGKGRLTCGRSVPYQRVLTGSVRTPPPAPIAQAGTYGGTHFRRNVGITLEVLPGGRTVTNVSFRQIVARCEPPRILFLEPSFDDSYSIGADRSFSIISKGYTILGRFRVGAVRGTASFDAGGCKAGPLPWTATVPPTAPTSVLQGRYCGFTLRGPGICVDATSDGWVANARMGANVRCYAPSKETFTINYTYDGVIAIRPDLTFAVSVASIPLDGGGSMNWRLSGKFDDTGQVAGTGGFSRVSLVREGTRYSCRNAISAWSAKRGA